MEEIISFLKEIPKILEETSIIVFLVDGLGSINLGIRGFKKRFYTTVFPSSTPTFIYTLHSLLSPEEHGFLEWYMRYGDTIVSIPPWHDIVRDRKLELGKDVSRDDVFPFKSLSEILSEKGYSVTYYTPFPESTFTKATSVGARVIGIKYLSQIFPLDKADFILIYWPSIDSILHERYRSEAFTVELELLRSFIKILMTKIPNNTKLYILPDHGLTLCKQKYLLPTIDSILPVGGERVAFYKNLDYDEVKEVIEEKSVPAKVFKLNELKYFKNRISNRCYRNYGDIAVIAEEHVCFKYPFEKEEKQSLGAHGGLSGEETNIILWEYTKI